MKILQAVAIAALALAGGAQASEDLSREKEQRKVDFKNDKTKVTLHAQNEVGKVKDKLEFEIEGREKGLEARFRYKYEDSNKDSKTKVDIGFRVKAFSVIEYVDVGTQGNGYQADTDTLVKQLQIAADDKDNWEEFLSSEETKAQVGVKVFSTQTKPVAGDTFVFGAVGRYAEKPVSFVNNSLTYNLGPDSVKFDFHVKNWEYASEDSSLAIEGRFKTKSKLKVASKGKMVAEEGESAPKFLWASTVFADAEEVPVIASPVKQPDSKDTPDDADKDIGDADHKMYFSFITTARVKNYNWDPNIGVSFTSGAARASLSVCSLLAVALAFFANN